MIDYETLETAYRNKFFYEELKKKLENEVISVQRSEEIILKTKESTCGAGIRESIIKSIKKEDIEKILAEKLKEMINDIETQDEIIKTLTER